jgi:hypothetical protein
MVRVMWQPAGIRTHKCPGFLSIALNLKGSWYFASEKSDEKGGGSIPIQNSMGMSLSVGFLSELRFERLFQAERCRRTVAASVSDNECYGGVILLAGCCVAR